MDLSSLNIEKFAWGASGLKSVTIYTAMLGVNSIYSQKSSSMTNLANNSHTTGTNSTNNSSTTTTENESHRQIIVSGMEFKFTDCADNILLGNKGNWNDYSFDVGGDKVLK
eukprot:CAMPEP_0116896948 /NCGR_PEP_ID=MMETSP0467-20121206/6073_1 /TAXON_ID=283647 /ORGANISM="Mesodinium pulex, Strain SPMC105" /LENGTH=110 /DNA_ID=CAMNT_0004568391 /DNA_START=1072 /DNA_END=1404 /DNA_ORIENTATION=-